ncbi:hypothetical protein STAQ_27970 [Allostella sp. ATCC 35155]|nr:hypothetical protein STAQ_27970 [Stella sp. ATCC 35155]
MTLSEFIDALGGTAKVAEIFGVGPSAVSNWKAWGRLPDRLHLRAARLAADRGLDFDPAAGKEAA